jgi:hypothetical protein
VPKIAYVTNKKWSDTALDLIEKANEIVARYAAQGFNLTLRQLYYQFVAGDLFPASWADRATGSTNNEKSYDKLGAIVSDARMCGLIDWDAIIDRTRSLRTIPAWSSPSAIVEAVSTQFKLDLWNDQPNRVEIWVEKDAAIGVVENICAELRVPHFSCRGYTSQSAMWEAAQRLFAYRRRGQTPHVIHLGDHDPSGIDMSRDIEERLRAFMAHHDREYAESLVFERIALNMNQVERYTPPPNPTKVTDSRAKSYIDRFGEECWELDALEPSVVADLIESTVRPLIRKTTWSKRVQAETDARKQLSLISQNYDVVVSRLEGDETEE